MIFIDNVRNVHKGQYDEIHAITRSPKGLPAWIQRNMKLAPSQQLERLLNKLFIEERIDEETFSKEWAPKYLEQLARNSDEIHRILVASNAGKTIAFVTLEDEPQFGPLAVLQEIYIGMKCPVNTKIRNDTMRRYATYAAYMRNVSDQMGHSNGNDR